MYRITMNFHWICLLALSSCVMAENWRERLVPSLEAEHGYVNGNWEAPGAKSFRKVTQALQQLQANNNITEDLLATLPGLPRVTTINVSMSDGTPIWTRIVNPWPYDKKKPACLVRSPYGSYASQNLALIFLVLNGHAAVMQEGRGTWRSGGVFDMWRGAAPDATDTINWITGQNWSSGEIYTMGGSADGIEAVEVTLAQPKPLHGMWLIWTSANGHNFIYPGGAYRSNLMSGYLDSLNGITHGASVNSVLPATQREEAYGPWWYNLTGCANASDTSVAPGCRYTYIKWPVVMNAGWWDIFHHTMLDAWQGMREYSDSSVRDDHVLIIGPLGHNIAAQLDAGAAENARLQVAEADALVVGGELNSEFWRWNHCSDEWASNNVCECNGRVRFGKGDVWSAAILVKGSIKCNTNNFPDPLPFQAKECQCQHSTGKLRQRIGRVNLFVMGNFGLEVPTGPGNFWTSLDEFPAFSKKAMYFNAGAILQDQPAETSGSAPYQYDPRDPAPMLCGNILPGIGDIKFGGSCDQLPRENRSDVLIFDSAPLTKDTPVVGAVSATLFVTSSAVDTDFFVTIEDLHPDGRKSMLVRFGMQRMRWRENQITRSAPLIAGKVYETEVHMGYTAYIFPKSHRIRVSVTSAANPYYNPSSNTGSNDMTTKVDPVIAHNAVHFAPNQPSRMNLPVASLDDIPQNPHFTAVGPFMPMPTEYTLV